LNLKDLFSQNIPVRDRIEEYRNNEAINRSELKAALEGPASLAPAKSDELYYEDEEAMLLGSIVDAMLTSPELIDDYFVGKCNTKPSDNLQSILHEAYDRCVQETGLLWHELENISTISVIHSIMNKVGYNMQWAKEDPMDDARIWQFDKKRVNQGCKLPQDYWKDLQKSKGAGKKLVSKEQMSIAETTCQQMQASPVTQSYCECNENTFEQVPIYFEHNGESYKVLVDKIIFHEEDFSLEPLDFKVMGGPTSVFPSRAKKYRLDLQGVLYTLGMREVIRFINNLMESSGSSQRFKLRPFKFVVNSHTHPYEPRIYEFEKFHFDIGYHGAYFRNGSVVLNESYRGDDAIHERNYEILGFLDALHRLKWYRNNGDSVHYDYAKNSTSPLKLWF